MKLLAPSPIRIPALINGNDSPSVGSGSGCRRTCHESDIGEATWAVFLLQFLEQENVFKRWDLTKTYYEQPALVREAQVKVYYGRYVLTRKLMIRAFDLLHAPIPCLPSRLAGGWATGCA